MSNQDTIFIQYQRGKLMIMKKNINKKVISLPNTRFSKLEA